MADQSRPIGTNQGFVEEERYLQEVLTFIDSEIATTTSLLPARAAHQQTADALQKKNKDYLQDLEQARPSSHLRRLDFIRDDSPAEKQQHYIGKFAIPGKVSSWQSPIAKVAFDPSSYEKGYMASNEFISGQIDLVREITIEQSTLAQVTDLFKRQGITAEQTQIMTQPSMALASALSAPADGELHDIVETIQPAQYQQIANSSSPVMIIQGAAGSGKSLVGLHRLAFLLSPLSDIGEMPRPGANRVIMFGPSLAFLNYVRNLLPSLGNDDIKQTTLTKWMEDSFNTRPPIEETDALFLRLINNRGKLSAEESDAELFKGSRLMAEVLDRFVETERDRLVARAPDITVNTPQDGHLTVESVIISRYIRQAKRAPLNQARQRVIELVVHQICQQSDFRANLSYLDRLREIVSPQVHAQVDAFWKIVDYKSAYRDLMTDPSTLAELTKATMTLEKARSVSETLSGQTRVFRKTDMAPLLFLDHLLNEHPTQGFEHIVVDEAQDVSPLEILLLKKHSRNGYFTILGDIRQRIVPYRGVANWREMGNLFDRGTVHRFESRTSYRNTFEITRFTNRILQQVHGSTALPLPFERHGPQPNMEQSDTVFAMMESLEKEIRRLKDNGASTIGVLTKWSRNANIYFQDLTRKGLADIQLLDASVSIKNNVIVSPTLLTKGLEFDAVIMVGVSNDIFTGSDFDNRLLYLGCTRARTALSILWVGRISPVLKFQTR